MEKSASFSGKEIENVSMNFSELRKKGLEYIQDLSGDIWTDYNSHDPGVTILEQLCYSLTDLALRTSLPVEDLLISGKDVPLNLEKNAFLPAPSILSSLPVTTDDIRKMIIDKFDEIQNVWITIKENVGYEEALRGINQIEILPKINFLNAINANPEKKPEFLLRVNNFLNENRNIGEYFEDAILLEPQEIDIRFNVYITEDTDLEITIARLFLQLLEYVYIPLQISSLTEMEDAGYSMEETFSGPKLMRGFIKDDIQKKRLKTIHVELVQKVLSKVDGIVRCEVEPFSIDGKSCLEIPAEYGKFFHLLQIDQSTNFIDNRFERIYKNMTIFINDKALAVLNKHRINSLFSEIWSKKYRAYSLEGSLTEFLTNKIKGTYRNPDEYYSLQRHFPIIYGIGENGLSKNEPEERQARALQLKAYLVLFEQHLANHLAQLGNLNEFFNINFSNGNGKTYFTQWMNSVPQMEKLASGNISDIEEYLEQKEIFYTRKNRIYNHLLARFGEDISDIPWKVSRRLNLIRNDDDFNRVLLQHKSNFLKHLEQLTYFRTRGEYFEAKGMKGGNPAYTLAPSGLEKIVLAKTGIPERQERFLAPEFLESTKQLPEEIEAQNEIENVSRDFRQVLPHELNRSYTKVSFINIPQSIFKILDFKALYKETLNLKNYRISTNTESNGKVQVLFQREKNKWVNLFTSPTEEKAIQKISHIINFFIAQNQNSEGLYIVDHILLRDILTDSKYGFKFIDYDLRKDEESETEPDEPQDVLYNEDYYILFQTIDEQSWCKSEEERNNSLIQFYSLGKARCSYRPEGDNWAIKDTKGRIIASCKPGVHNRETSDDELTNLRKKTRSIIQLFNGSKKTNGRLRFKEVEKIRAKGSLEAGSNHYGQRRLVFQRKLSNGEIIDEDFFNMMITVLLPDWPARFQTERIKDYVSDLIYERLPSHISNNILWIDAPKLKQFEEKYHLWQQLRLQSKITGIPSDEVRAAALEVYHTIMELKKNQE